MATIINKSKTDQIDAPTGPPVSNVGPAYMGMGSPRGQSQGSSGSPRFTNIQQFLGANVGAGQKLAGKVLEQKSTLESGIKSGEEAAGNVKRDVESQIGKIKTSGEQAAEAIKGISGGQQYINENKPTEEFTNLYTGQAGLPQYQQQATSALGQTQQAIQGLGQFGQKLGTEAGRNELLSGSVGRAGKYGQGLSTLDQVLLQRGGRNELESAVGDIRRQVPGQMQQYQQLVNTLTGADTGALSQLGKQASSTQDLLEGTLGGEQSAFEKAQQKEASTLSGQRSQQQELMKQFLSGGYTGLNTEQQQSIKDVLAKQGLGAGQRLYSDIDPTEFFKYGQSQVGAQDVVNEQELARYRALSTLSGMSPEALKYSSVGTFGGGQPINIDPRLAERISVGEQAYEKKLNESAVKNAYDTLLPNTGGFRSENPFTKSEYTYNDLSQVSNINAKEKQLIQKYKQQGNPYPEWQARRDMRPQYINAGLVIGGNTDLTDRGIDALANQLGSLESMKQQQGYYNRLGGSSMEEIVPKINIGK